MKNTIYYILLLIAIALITGYLISSGNSMDMKAMSIVGTLLVGYTVGLSLVGEGAIIDERQEYHRYISTRIAYITGVSILCIGIIYQLFTHNLDYWLLAGLIVINLSKIISLIWLEQKK